MDSPLYAERLAARLWLVHKMHDSVEYSWPADGATDSHKPPGEPAFSDFSENIRRGTDHGSAFDSISGIGKILFQRAFLALFKYPYDCLKHGCPFLITDLFFFVCLIYIYIHTSFGFYDFCAFRVSCLSIQPQIPFFKHSPIKKN